MPKPTEEILHKLGDDIEPQRKLLEGEALPCDNFDASDDGYPPDARILSDFNELSDESRYLWVIDSEGVILVTRERVPNLSAPRRYMCHTNITRGAAAKVGGELWFGLNQTVYLFKKSGRYPSDDEKWSAAMDCFRLAGYVVEDRTAELWHEQ